MKAKHKYILTLSTLALFLISVFIGYFISTAVVSKAPQAEGGGCPNITCSSPNDCSSCDNKFGVCEEGYCKWPPCSDEKNCVSGYCCDKQAGFQVGDCFTENIYIITSIFVHQNNFGF
jgi:hypothetical protein